MTRCVAVLGVLAALAVCAFGQVANCEYRSGSCVDCLMLEGTCHYCPASQTCSAKGTFDIDCLAVLVEAQGQCAEQQCSWYKLTLNPHVCDVRYPIALGIALVTLAVSLLAAPALMALSLSPWAHGSLDESGLCVFTHQPTDGLNVCSRCGVTVASLVTVGGTARVCVGCRAVYVGRGLLGAALTLCALAISIFFIGWGGVVIAFALEASVWLVCLPALGWQLLRLPVRRFLFGVSRAGYGRVGAAMGETQLTDGQLAILAALPERYRDALVAALRYDEEILWAYAPPPHEVLKRDFAARTQLCTFLAYTVPLFATGLLLLILGAPRAVMFVFWAIAALLALLSGPPLVPLLLRTRCGYVLTSRRALIVRPLATGGLMTDAADFRALHELRFELDGNGTSGLVRWDSLFFPGFFYVDQLARVRQILSAAASASRAAQAAGHAAGAPDELALAARDESGELESATAMTERGRSEQEVARVNEREGARDNATEPREVTARVAHTAVAAAAGALETEDRVIIPDSLREAGEIELRRQRLLTEQRAQYAFYRNCTLVPPMLVAMATAAAALGYFPLPLLVSLGPILCALTGVVYQSALETRLIAEKLEGHRFVVLHLDRGVLCE